MARTAHDPAPAPHDGAGKRQPRGHQGPEHVEAHGFDQQLDRIEGVLGFRCHSHSAPIGHDHRRESPPAIESFGVGEGPKQKKALVVNQPRGQIIERGNRLPLFGFCEQACPVSVLGLKSSDAHILAQHRQKLAGIVIIQSGGERLDGFRPIIRRWILSACLLRLH